MGRSVRSCMGADMTLETAEKHNIRHGVGESHQLSSWGVNKYQVRLVCSNCGMDYMYTIDKGRTVEQAKLICETCGCAALTKTYGRTL